MLKKLDAVFCQAGIDTSYSGFYNDPAFVRLEEQNPYFLQNYGFFVKYQSYKPKYLDYVRAVVPPVVKILHDELKFDGRLSACVDMSNGMSKVLEQHGIWCAVVAGGFNAKYPDPAIEDRYLWHLNDPSKPFCLGSMPGHVWLFCPPFEVIDITIKYQPYNQGQAEYLPSVVLQEKGTPFTATMRDLCGLAVRKVVAAHGISESQYFEQTLFSHFTKHMRPMQYKIKKTKLRYIPFNFMASDAKGIEGVQNLTFRGKSLHALYLEKLVPILSGSGRQ